MNKRFRKIILICQDLRKKYGDDYEKKCSKKIQKFTNEIINDNLIAKCDKDEQYFAWQLCIANSLKIKI